MAEPIEIPPDATDGTFRPELRNFADRIRWVRVFVLRLNSVSEMARRLGYPSQTVETWEKGARPREVIEVAHRYHEVAPEVPVAWLLTGSVTFLTYGDTNDTVSYAGFVVVDERQGRLDLEPFPPSRSDPPLTLVS